MTGTDSAPERDPDYAARGFDYLVALLPPVFTVLPSLVDVVFVVRPPYFVFLSILLAALLATGLAYSPWRPGPVRLLALGILAPLLYGPAVRLGLTAGTDAVVGSLPLVADTLLVWLTVYSLAAFVVYGLDGVGWLRRRYDAIAEPPGEPAESDG